MFKTQFELDDEEEISKLLDGLLQVFINSDHWVNFLFEIYLLDIFDNGLEKDIVIFLAYRRKYR